MKKNLIFITGKMVRGGSERVISVLAGHFCKKYNIKIITLLDSVIEYELDKSIEVVNLYKTDSHRILKVPGWIYHLCKQFKSLNRKDTVVISFVARTNLIVLIANLFCRLPVIISERNDPIKDGRGIITKILVQLLYPKAHKIVFQSEYARSLFNKRIIKKGIVIHNPIIVPNFDYLQEKKKVVVNIGRLSTQKNQSLLIKAFADVLKEHPDFTLRIYGEGPLRNNLYELVEKLDIGDKVDFAGVVDDIHEKIADCGMFVLSSDYEGQSNALLEAMAMGIPCITTDMPGQREILNNSNSISIEPGNQKQLAEAMSKLMDNPDFAGNIGEKAILTMKELSGEVVLSVWEKVIGNAYEQ